MPEEKNLCSETNRRRPCGECVKKLEPKVCAESDINVPRWNHWSQRKLASFIVYDLRRTAS